jgi:Golgi phosphoprotein 3 (GPP34)
VLLAEEFLLLCFDDQTGKKIISSDKIEPGLGGALLVELALNERIGVTAESAGWRQSGRLTITDISPTDDPVLDSALAKLQTLEGKKIKLLLSRMSSKRITKGLERRLLERLAAAGVLRLERDTVLGLFPGRTWPASDTSPEEGVRERLHTALIAGLTPTERTVALIGLLEATGLLTKVVPSEDRRSLRRRAKELTEGDWAARAVKQAIEEVAAAAAAAAGAGAGADGGGGS